MNSVHRATQIDTIVGRQPAARSLYKMDYNPKDYLKPSAARVKLAGRMFGGLPRRQDIDKLKNQLPHLRVRSGDWQEPAAKCLREAAVAGEISVYIFNASDVAASETSLPSRLSLELVCRLTPTRGGFPDYPYRIQPSLMRDGLVTDKWRPIREADITDFSVRVSPLPTWRHGDMATEGVRWFVVSKRKAALQHHLSCFSVIAQSTGLDFDLAFFLHGFRPFSEPYRENSSVELRLNLLVINRVRQAH